MPLPLPPATKFYFPNIIFRLVRSSLPPHQAVFRVPPQLNKLDIQSYLSSIYGLQLTDVRTMNYEGKRFKDRLGKWDKTPAYKKVIVTMKEDFVFPDPPVVRNVDVEAKEANVENAAMPLAPRLPLKQALGNRSVKRYRGRKDSSEARKHGFWQ